LAYSLGYYSSFLFRRLDPVAEETLENGNTLMSDDAQGVGKVALTNGRACFNGTFKHQEELLRALQRLPFALQFDPTLPGGSLYSELKLDGLEVAGIVVVELLSDAVVFEVQGFSGHSRRNC